MISAQAKNCFSCFCQHCARTTSRLPERGAPAPCKRCGRGDKKAGRGGPGRPSRWTQKSQAQRNKKSLATRFTCPSSWICISAPELPTVYRDHSVVALEEEAGLPGGVETVLADEAQGLLSGPGGVGIEDRLDRVPVGVAEVMDHVSRGRRGAAVRCLAELEAVVACAAGQLIATRPTEPTEQEVAAATTGQRIGCVVAGQEVYLGGAGQVLDA